MTFNKPLKFLHTSTKEVLFSATPRLCTEYFTIILAQSKKIQLENEHEDTSRNFLEERNFKSSK